MNLTLQCDNCGKIFNMSVSRAISRYIRYNNMHLCLSCSKLGDKNPFYNKRFSEEQKEEFSKIRSDYYNDPIYGEKRRKEQSERFSGKNNPMYTGGELRPDYSSRNKKIRREALKRDNNTCAYCGRQLDPSELETHHINSWHDNIDGRHDINNVITLCKDCHRLFHSIYGKTTNQNQYNSFIESSETSLYDVGHKSDPNGEYVKLPFYFA